jgi:GNAT superfamily N-acetyltransferase
MVEAARPATAADVAQMIELAERAREELGPTRGGKVFLAREARQEPLAASLGAALEDAHGAAWVGTIDDTVVGYAVVHAEEIGDHSCLGIVDDLFVEAGARAVGVGELLMDAALAWCRAQGCAGVDATALPGNRETKNFFEESGFTARLLIMHRRLDG